MPRKVKVANSHSIPLFAGSANWWNIVYEDAALKENPVCAVMFPELDHRHPDYKTYLAGVRVRAQEVADLINKGLGHGSAS